MSKPSAAVLLCLSWLFLPPANAGSIDPQAMRIFERAVKAAVDTREYSAEISQTAFTQDLTAAADGKPKPAQWFRMSGSQRYRAPDQAWSRIRTPRSERLTLVDGKRSYEYVTAPDGREQATVEDFIPNETGWLYTYEELKGLKLSPLLAQVGTLTPLAAWRKVPEGEDVIFKTERDRIDVRYLGREVLAGVLCDAVQFTTPIDSDQWSRARKVNAALPAGPGPLVRRVYFGADDGLIRRDVQISEIPGVELSVMENVYTVGALDREEDFTRARLDAELRSLRGDRPPPQFQEKHIVAGESLPAIEAVRADGKPLNWADFRGKVLVVQTWATWCVPCKKAMPYYDRIRRQLAGRDVVFLALSFDQTREAYERWLKEHGKEFGFLFARARVDAENWEQELGRLKGSLPAFYVLDREGRIVVGYSGNDYRRNTEDPRLAYALGLAGVKLP